MESKFLQYGLVRCDLFDAPSRQAILHLCIPCYLLQVATPVLLGAGLLDNPKIRQPLAIWVPKFRDERLTPPARLDSGIGSRTTSLVHEWVERYAQFFVQISAMFMDPTDLVPILPLGTYVEAQYRCSIDSIPELLEKLQAIEIVGIPEFQFALAEVLHRVLTRFSPGM